MRHHKLYETEKQIEKLNQVHKRLRALKDRGVDSHRKPRESILEKFEPSSPIVIPPKKPMERGIYNWVVSAYRKFKDSNYVVLGLGILGLVFSFLFLSNNLTGNSILLVNQTFSNFIGGLFFVFGLMGIFFYLKKR
ncbi:hypothetical protein J4474_03875 [Candidatus Pacearchaeota archaeon]|nr:hypothetical protein [Candidatus Pacearchaeota archaeon]